MELFVLRPFLFAILIGAVMAVVVRIQSVNKAKKNEEKHSK